MTDASFGAGYGSSRALYARVWKELGMSPLVYRRGGDGERISFTIANSSLGRMLVARTEYGICALWWGDDEQLTSLLRQRFPRASIVQNDLELAPLVERIDEHLRKSTRLPDESMDVRGTEFQRRVWKALMEIPLGETRTYAQLAAMIGQPKAVQAVANACAANPIALLIPCHRVIRSNGELAGYRWGIERKEALLSRESVNVDRRV